MISLGSITGEGEWNDNTVTMPFSFGLLFHKLEHPSLSPTSLLNIDFISTASAPTLPSAFKRHSFKPSEALGSLPEQSNFARFRE
jgi:hypothetical protein